MTNVLVTRLHSGDERAWEQVYDMLAPELRGYISRLGARDPDDVLGETMVNIVRDIHRFEGSDNELRPWAFRIAHNRVIDAVRRKRSRPEEASDESLLNSRADLAPLAEMPDPQAISRLLDQLTDDQKTVIWLRYIADFSLADTATITGRTTEAVAALTLRGLRTLRVALSA